MAEAPKDPAQPEAAGTSPVTASGAGVQAALALYRKYRPATFAELRGQEQVTEPLRQALRSGRINHAYLFSGPRGCGKTSSARILARSLNCVEGPTPDPCGVCESCIALAPSGPGSIDVIEIDAASHGGVDDARELRERAFYAPVAGRFKVYIIDEAHMVTQQGFNALLKLVEEPPPHLKFIFATTEPEKVIPTIRSRTHHYPFRLVPPAILRQLLEDILVQEGVTFDPDVLPLVVRAGAGSVRDSLSVLDQLVAGSDESGLTYQRAIALLGYTDAALLDEITDAFAAADGGSVFRVVNRIVEGGHEPRRFAADLLDRFRDLIVLASVPDAGEIGLLDAPPDRLELMSAQAARFGLASLTRAAEIMSDGLDQMRGATSPRLLLELMCAQVLLPSAGTDEKSLLARLERLERGVALGGSQPGGAPVPQAPAPPGPRPVASDSAPSAPVRPRPPADDAAGEPASSGPASPASPGAGGAGPSTPAGSAGGSPSGSAPSAPEPSAPEPSSPEPSDTAAPNLGLPSDPGFPAEPEPAPEPPPMPAVAPSGSSDTETFARNWDAVLEAIKRERRVAWMLLSNATVLSLEGNVLTIRFARDGDVKGFTSSGCDADLKRVLSSRFGMNVGIKAVSANDPAASAGRDGRARLNAVTGFQGSAEASAASPGAAGQGTGGGWDDQRPADPGSGSGGEGGSGEAGGPRGPQDQSGPEGPRAQAARGGPKGQAGHAPRGPAGEPGPGGAGPQAPGGPAGESGPGGAGPQAPGGPAGESGPGGAGPQAQAGQQAQAGSQAQGGPQAQAGQQAQAGSQAQAGGPGAGGPGGTAGPGAQNGVTATATAPAASPRTQPPAASAPAKSPAFSPDIVDAIETPDADDLASPGQTELSGMDLIQRELGGQIIGEIED